MTEADPRKLRRAFAGLIFATVLALAACSGEGLLSDPATTASRLPAPRLLDVSAKATSGAPAGIYVTWTRIADASCQGYYLYRYTDGNRPPEPDPDDQPPFPIELRVNDGAMIPQPGSGDTVTFDDLFEPVVGETYYYRVTAVDDQEPAQESYPSAEDSWTVHGHTVTGLTPLSAYWGDEITITGDTFGAYDEGTDAVRFPAVGESYAFGAIIDWSDTEINATVPELAVTGPVAVVIAGTVAYTDEDLTILQPAITSIDPAEGFVEQDLVISGVNFGSEQDGSTVAIGEIDASSAVSAWSDTEITLNVPVATVRGDVLLTIDSHDSNGVEFTPRPEIQGVDPVTAQSGEPLTLTGRKFLDVAGSVLLDGATELTVVDWADETITITLVAIEGEHTLTVRTSDDVAGNDYAYTVAAPLAVSFTGLLSEALYVPGLEPVIVVDTPTDTDSVELLVDGAVVGDATTEPPFDGLALDFAALVNGSHDVQVRAHRRAVTAESEAMAITVYSLVGDVNADGLVDIADRDRLDTLRGMTDADPGFLPWYDTDGDGEITEADLSALGYNWNDAVLP